MIREANKEDIEKLISMWGALDNHVANITNNTVLNSKEKNYMDMVNQFIREILNCDDALLYVEDSDEELKGFVSAHIEKLAWFKPSTGLIGAIWVNKHHRNKGIGKQLLNHAEYWLKSKNVVNIQVCWDLENKDAEIFWERNNYFVSQLRGTKIIEN